VDVTGYPTQKILKIAREQPHNRMDDPYETTLERCVTEGVGRKKANKQIKLHRAREMLTNDSAPNASLI
jgi:hypothetical protein